jgi:hypothetical protein
VEKTESEEREVPELYLNTKEVVRSPEGQFVSGTSGNPKGRPKGAKNRITELKQEMELVLREGINPDVLKSIIASMAAEAMGGNVQAAKLILDRFMTTASSAEEDGEKNPVISIKITNLTPKILEEVTGTTYENEAIPDGKSI